MVESPLRCPLLWCGDMTSSCRGPSSQMKASEPFFLVSEKSGIIIEVFEWKDEVQPTPHTRPHPPHRPYTPMAMRMVPGLYARCCLRRSPASTCRT